MYMTHLNLINAFALVVTVWGLSQIARIVRRRWHTTPLRGPPSPSFLYGIKQVEAKQRQTHGVYNPWVATYGGAFRVAAPMGTTRIVLTDPKAVAHVLSQDTWGYTHPGPEKAAIEAVVCSSYLVIVSGLSRCHSLAQVFSGLMATDTSREDLLIFETCA